MAYCHLTLPSKFILALSVFIFSFGTILTVDETNCYLSDNVRSKRAAKDEVLVFDNLNPNADEGSQVVESGERQIRSTKLNFEKDYVGSQGDVESNDDADQEGDDIDDKGVLSHSISDRHAGRRSKSRSGPKMWDHWGKWTSCSVSCGIGKMTRWRHCVSGGCSAGEKEAQIKTCSLAAC